MGAGADIAGEQLAVGREHGGGGDLGIDAQRAELQVSGFRILLQQRSEILEHQELGLFQPGLDLLVELPDVMR